MTHKILIYLFVFFIFLSCAKKEDPVVAKKTGIVVEILGATNFGGVIIGNYKDASVRITNYESKTETLDFSKIIAPYSISSKSVSCISGQLSSGNSCIVTVRFQPITAGTYQDNLSRLNPLINSSIYGIGLINGYLTVDTQLWEIGTQTAGLLKTKIVNITNNGDLTVKTPTFILPNKVVIGVNHCGSYIGAKTTCAITFEARLETAGSYSEYISGTSQDGGSVGFNFTATVNPANPSGLIGFNLKPINLSSAGAEFIFKTNPIVDEYGNVVAPNTSVNASGNSLLLLLDGNTYYTNANGEISFRVRTRTIKGTGAVSVFAGQASGSYSFPIVAGDAFGTITANSILSEIPANGISQVIVNTDIILDQYNNIVEDGTPIVFEVTGSATVATGLDPKVTTGYTINGVARVVITSGTIAEVAQLKIKSGPIVDPFGNIIGYSANGVVNLNFVPGVADGNIPVSTAFHQIYADSNPPVSLNLPYKTGIIIGPIRDQFGNIVKTGSEININISNGYYDTISGLPLQNFKLYTDSNGNASFDLIGAGVRGNINVLMNAAFASGSIDVWALFVSKTHYEKNKDNVSLGFRHFKSTLFPSATTNWAEVKNPSNIESQDNTYYGYLKDSNDPQTAFGSNVGLPYFTWDCFYSADELLIGNFCMQPDGLLSPLYKYDKNHNLRTDFPDGNPAPELVTNTSFSANKQLQFWLNESDGGKSYGIKYDAANQMMEIDNSLAIDPYDSAARKVYAYSDWIPVDSTKKYAFKFSVKQQFGNNVESKKVEVGVVEASESITVINNESYVLDPRILRNDISLSGAYIGSSYNMVYKPVDGTTYIRLYFSTVGTGDGTLVRLDDISLKLLNTQNIHENGITEGVSIAYVPGNDTLLMFGGDTLNQQGTVGNYSYSGIASNRNTLMSKMLDVSTSVIVDNINTNEKLNLIGSIPSARSHAGLVPFQDKIFSFGGFNNQSEDGSAFNDTYIFDGLNKNWSSISILDDANFGKPANRYENGLAYVDSLKKIYIGGGLSQDEQNPELWSLKDDIWSIKVDQSSGYQWKRECDNCGIFSESGFKRIAEFLKTLLRFPNGNNNLNNYVTSLKNVKRNKLLWHPPTQNIYTHSPETTGLMKSFNPYSNVIDSVSSAFGLTKMTDAFQMIYNEFMGRTFAYKRGNQLLEDSKIYYWDMDIDDKQFVKARFKYDVKAKQTLKRINFNVYAYGQTKTLKEFGSVDNNGVLVYIFDHNNMNWVLKGSNTAISNGTLNSPINFYIEDNSVLNYISNDGFIDILLTTRGRPGMEGSEPLMGNDLAYIDVGSNTQTYVDYTVQSISTMGRSTIILRSDNTIVSWGRNNAGQLGLGSASNQIGGTVNSMGNNLMNLALFDHNNVANSSLSVVKIFTGDNHACALFNNNRAKCWGDNTYGQAGYTNIGTKTFIGDSQGEMSDSLPFIDVGTEDGTIGTGPAKIVSLSLGQSHTCAVIEQISNTATFNRVKCWGKKTEGQLGLGSSTGSGSFNLLLGNSTSYINFTINSGSGDVAQTIYDPTINSFRLKGVNKVISGSLYNCAVMEDSSIYCWGDNTYGQLGIGSTTTLNYPGVRANILATTINQIEAGADHWCVFYEYGVDTGYNTLCIGKNNHGQLGIGSIDNRGDQNNELNTLYYTNWGDGLFPKKLTLGSDYTCAILNNNRIKCFGSNADGVLGLGSLISDVGTSSATIGDNNNFIDLGTNGSQPIQVKSIVSNFNGNYLCAQTMDDMMKCWGNNDYGQLGLEDKRNRGHGYSPSKGTTELKIDYIESEEIY